MQELPDFELPPLSGEAIHESQRSQEMLQAESQLKPEADPYLCTGCGECLEHCPVSAMTMDTRQIPVVNGCT